MWSRVRSTPAPGCAWRSASRMSTAGAVSSAISGKRFPSDPFSNARCGGIIPPCELRETAMAYVQNRIVHDADSHLMELPDSLDAYFDPKFRAAYDALPKLQKNPRDAGWVRKSASSCCAWADSNVL